MFPYSSSQPESNMFLFKLQITNYLKQKFMFQINPVTKKPPQTDGSNQLRLQTTETRHSPNPSLSQISQLNTSAFFPTLLLEFLLWITVYHFFQIYFLLFTELKIKSIPSITSLSAEMKKRTFVRSNTNLFVLKTGIVLIPDKITVLVF